MARRAGTGGGPAPRQTAVHPDASAWPPDARACSGYQRASTLPGSRARASEFQTKHSRAPTPCQERKRVPGGVPGLLCVLVRKRSYQKQSNHRQPALGWWDAGRLATGATAQAVLAWRKGLERLWGDPSALGRNAAVRLGWGGTAQTRTCPRGTHRPLRVSLWPACGLKPKARSRAAGKASVGLWMRT